jgi:RNA polymerase sigma-70 factor (ECF subfamily)
VHRRVPNDVAGDLVQQAFITVWEQRATLRDDGSLRGLLFRIAYTRALNHFRDTKRFEDSETEFASPESPPSDSAESRLIRDRLAAVVATLPERRRATFELCMLEGLTYREAAEVLGVSMKTVENQMSHALKAVRAAMQVHREKD